MQISQSSNASNVLLGGAGAVIITDTATYTGPFYCIKAISDCVIDTATFSPNITGSLSGLSIGAGDSIPLYTIETIKLISGSAVLYRSIPL